MSLVKPVLMLVDEANSFSWSADICVGTPARSDGPSSSGFLRMRRTR
jgi:hypothetical protein